MFVERLAKSFKTNEPIFIEEILELLQEYSRAQVFRYIDKAKQNKEIVQFDKGVYYIPSQTFWGGISTITANSVIEKRYLRNSDDVYGIIGGMKLLNVFSFSTQMPSITDIITNKETTRCREVEISSRKFVLHKPHCQINKKNYAAYTILQFFNDLSNEDCLNDETRKKFLNISKTEM